MIRLHPHARFWLKFVTGRTAVICRPSLSLPNVREMPKTCRRYDTRGNQDFEKLRTRTVPRALLKNVSDEMVNRENHGTASSHLKLTLWYTRSTQHGCAAPPSRTLGDEKSYNLLVNRERFAKMIIHREAWYFKPLKVTFCWPWDSERRQRMPVNTRVIDRSGSLNLAGAWIPRTRYWRDTWETSKSALTKYHSIMSNVWTGRFRCMFELRRARIPELSESLGTADCTRVPTAQKISMPIGCRLLD